MGQLYCVKAVLAVRDANSDKILDSILDIAYNVDNLISRELEVRVAKVSRGAWQL